MQYEVVAGLMTPGEPGDLLAAFHRPAWMSDAACRGEDTAAFVPARSDRVPQSVGRICAGCPVVVECLQYALERPELLGVWGGLGDADRKLLRRMAA